MRDRVADPKVRAEIADALLEPTIPATITNPHRAGDFRALRRSARQGPFCARRLYARCRPPTCRAKVLARGLARPVLLVCGEKDDLTGAPDGLAAAFSRWQSGPSPCPNRDLAMTAVGDKVYKAAVLDFLANICRICLVATGHKTGFSPHATVEKPALSRWGACHDAWRIRGRFLGCAVFAAGAALAAPAAEDFGSLPAISRVDLSLGRTIFLRGRAGERAAHRGRAFKLGDPNTKPTVFADPGSFALDSMWVNI